MAAGFDTLRAARRLKEAGATDAVAEAIVGPIRDARDFDLWQLATKADIADLRSEIARAELRLIRWVIGIASAAVIVIVGALSDIIWTAVQVLLHVGHP